MVPLMRMVSSTMPAVRKRTRSRVSVVLFHGVCEKGVSHTCIPRRSLLPTLRDVALLVHSEGERQGDGPTQPAPGKEHGLLPVDACRDGKA